MSGDDFIRAGEVPHHEIKQPVWLMSFADFAGCLLASFVLLYSLAQNDREKMQAIFGIAKSETEITATDGNAEKSMEAKESEEGRDTDYLATLLKTKIDAAPALKDIKVLPQEADVLLDLPLARLNAAPESREDDLLFALAGVLSVLPNESSVSAEVPQAGTQENWAKGMVLANAVATRLMDSGAAENLVARTGISSDGAMHVRILIRREAGE